MNTADRSLGQIDYALRRRFAFYTIKADRWVIEDYYSDKSDELKNDALALFDRVDEFLTKDNIVNDDINKDDIMVGHSYFMAETKENFEFKKEYEIKSLLEEYRKDGVINASIKAIEELFNGGKTVENA
jgi:5-methylcytosine-specific restriction protein B